MTELVVLAAAVLAEELLGVELGPFEGSAPELGPVELAVELQELAADVGWALGSAAGEKLAERLRWLPAR